MRATVKLKRLRAKYFQNQLQVWQVVQLGKFGGYSHRTIARLVLHKQHEGVTEQEIAAVAYILRREGVRVRDWREAKTPIAAKYARARMRIKSKRRAAG